MRVDLEINGVQGGTWVGAWLTTTATHPRKHMNLNATVRHLNADPGELFPRYQIIFTFAMEDSGNCLYVQPFSACCSPAAAERSSRTSTGSRCVLNCCIDILPGFHFSNSASCNLQRSSSFDSCQQQVHIAQSMPRLRPRMRCRRAGAIGRAINRSSPSNSDSSSYSSEFGPVRIPAPRRGRGKGRNRFNPAGHFRLSSRAHSHHARFHFPCSVNNTSLLATVTIDLRAAPSDQATSDQVRAASMASLEPTAGAEHCNLQADIQQNVSSPDKAANLDFEANPSAPPDGDQARHGAPPPVDEDPYNFGCLIVEEDPPSAGSWSALPHFGFR